MPARLGVTIALNDISKFSSNMKKAYESAKQLDISLEDLKASSSGAENSIAALAQKQEYLTQKQKAYNEALSSAKSARNAAAQTYEEQQKAVDELRESLERAQKAGDTGEVGKIQKQFSSAETALSRYNAGVSRWDTQIAKAESNVKKANTAVSQDAKYLDEAKNSADGCATSIDKFGNEIGKAGDEAQGSTQKAGSFLDRIKTGFSERIGSLATEELRDLGQAAFNMQASESGKLADIIATAQAKSKTTADQLAEAYGTSATNMTQYGQSVETTTALLEGMASVNDTGSAAGTKLSAVMSQMIQKSKDGAIAIGDYNVSLYET